MSERLYFVAVRSRSGYITEFVGSYDSCVEAKYKAKAKAMELADVFLLSKGITVSVEFKTGIQPTSLRVEIIQGRVIGSYVIS